MENENAVGKRKTGVKKRLKVLLFVGLSLVTLIFVARLIWRFSGSNQWELVQQKDGVKLYSLKMPGTDLPKLKGVVRLHTTLPRLVKMFQDPDVCLDAGCIVSVMIERVDDQQQYYSFQFKPPFPFQTREYVLREQFYQNPRSKEILVSVTGVPDRIPPDACCFRVTDMNNTWRFTPLADGQIEVEWITNTNEGGFMPDPMLYWLHPKIMMGFLPIMESLANREKYQNAKFDFIKERTQSDDAYSKSSALPRNLTENSSKAEMAAVADAGSRR